MPFMAEYACEYGHRFEHLHMGKRDECPDYLPCEGKLHVVDPVTQLAVEKTCSRMAERAISAPVVETIVKGNSDFNERQRERLEKRAADWSQSKAGKNTKMDAIERQIKNKNIVA